MVLNLRGFCLSCQIKKCFRCADTYYIDKHIPEAHRKSIKDCTYLLKTKDIKLKQFIRKGHFGCVCSAKMNGQKVAVKVVLNTKQPNFETEFDIIRDFDHINVITVIKEIKTIDVKFMFMPLAKSDFKEFIRVFINKHRRLLTENEVRPLFTQIVSGVKYIHEKGFAHKDIKLLNILVMKGLILKISDFDSIEYCYESDGKFKCKTIAIGTPSYFAPEILLREPISDFRKVDIWALGVVLFEMLFLRTPFIPIEGRKKKSSSQRLKYQPYVGDNQLTRNIPKNSNICSETMNLLNRFLINDFRLRERLSVIIETDPWFKPSIQLSDKKRRVPQLSIYDIYDFSTDKPMITKIYNYFKK